ncbi:hypothetical protein ILYODFUR_034796, partial [Ilyodon furcidens]
LSVTQKQEGCSDGKKDPIKHQIIIHLPENRSRSFSQPRGELFWYQRHQPLPLPTANTSSDSGSAFESTTEG